jgi:hypothetical protein
MSVASSRRFGLMRAGAFCYEMVKSSEDRCNEMVEQIERWPMAFAVREAFLAGFVSQDIARFVEPRLSDSLDADARALDQLVRVEWSSPLDSGGSPNVMPMRDLVLASPQDQKSVLLRCLRPLHRAGVARIQNTPNYVIEICTVPWILSEPRQYDQQENPKIDCSDFGAH